MFTIPPPPPPHTHTHTNSPWSTSFRCQYWMSLYLPCTLYIGLTLSLYANCRFTRQVAWMVAVMPQIIYTLKMMNTLVVTIIVHEWWFWETLYAICHNHSIIIIITAFRSKNGHRSVNSTRSSLDRNVELPYKCCNSIPVGCHRQNGNQSCTWGRCNVNVDWPWLQ